jgi:acetyl-CoA carboxylase biotin carboxyl carrier protein
MNFKELKELIDIVSSKENISELEVERSGVRLWIKKSSDGVSTAVSNIEAVSGEQSTPALAPVPGPAQTPAESPGLAYVTSPIVGTVYRASSPDADPFVNVGDFVEKGSVVCIIEAMKLMNEIESEVAGEIVSISVENGHPVEYGERLFAVRPR